jgi:gas vesicle protein
MTRNHHHSSNHNQNVLLGVLAGTVIGAITAAVVSTKGKEIRNHLNDAMDYASEKYEGAANSINETAHGISDRFLHRKNHASQRPNVAIGAIAGGILGISAILYLTGNSSKSLRERVAHSFENLSDRAHSYQEMAHSAVDSVGENISPILDKIEKFICAFTDKKNHRNRKNLSENNTLDNILDWAVVAAQVFQSFKK